MVQDGETVGLVDGIRGPLVLPANNMDFVVLKPFFISVLDAQIKYAAALIGQLHICICAVQIA